MRAAILGAALLASAAFLAVAPSAHAQQYGGYPAGYSNFGQPSYGPQYGGAYNAASPYAGVCTALAYSAATQGYAALVASPYTQTCEYLGLMGNAPGAGYASAYGMGLYGHSGQYGQSSYPYSGGSYPYSGGGSYYGVGGSISGLGYARNPYDAGYYGIYGQSWPYGTQ